MGDNLLRRCGAEAAGTFVLVFAGVGSAVLAGDQIGTLGIAIAFGLALLAMVYAIGPVSGCHVNPAVTFGMWLARRTDGRSALGYVAAQATGAVVAAAAVAVVASGRPGGYDIGASGLGANGFADHSPSLYAWGACFLLETVLTAFLVLTVIGSTSSRAPVGFAGIPIGLVLTLCHLVAIPITGTSVNPARSLGPAVFVGGWALEQLWLFVAAPLVGAALATGLYVGLRGEDTDVIDLAEAERSLPSEESEREQAQFLAGSGRSGGSEEPPTS